jgi:hypothetical protein
MPTMQAMAEKANAVFNREHVGHVDRNAVAPGKTLAESCQELGIVERTDTAAIDYLNTWPKGLQEALRAAVASAVERKLPVTIAWQAWYDYDLDISELPGTPSSIGGMTIVLRSPRPLG